MVLRETDVTKSDGDVIHLATQIASWVSFGCALFVFATFLVFKRQFPSSLALWFSFCSLLFTLPFLMGTFVNQDDILNDVWLCSIQGMYILYFSFFCL